MFDVSHRTLYIILFYKSHAAEARLSGEPLVSKFTFTRRLKRQRQAAELNVNFIRILSIIHSQIKVVSPTGLLSQC